MRWFDGSGLPLPALASSPGPSHGRCFQQRPQLHKCEVLLQCMSKIWPRNNCLSQIALRGSPPILSRYYPRLAYRPPNCAAADPLASSPCERSWGSNGGTGHAKLVRENAHVETEHARYCSIRCRTHTTLVRVCVVDVHRTFGAGREDPTSSGCLGRRLRGVCYDAYAIGD